MTRYALTPALAETGQNLLDFHRRATAVLDLIYHHGLLEADRADVQWTLGTLELLRDCGHAIDVAGFDMPAAWQFETAPEAAPVTRVAYSSADRNAAAEVANAYHNGGVTLVEMIRSIADIHANRSREQGESR